MKSLKSDFKFSFESLEVWQNSIALTKDIYIITKQFPDYEKFGLVTQIRRAIVSVSSNLAEGSAKTSLKDQARFTEIAFGSLLEVLNQLIIAQELGYMEEQDLLCTRETILNLSRQINALKNSQLRRSKHVKPE